MHYEPNTTDHGLAHDPFKSCVVPRPIGWISSLSPDGVANLAPYSQFQNLSFNPPYVMFSANEGVDNRGRKDSVVNVEQTGEFVWNMATYDLREAVNISARDFPPDVDEFEAAGVTKAASLTVKAPRVAESPVHFECEYYTTLRLPGLGKNGGGAADMVIGHVKLIHVDDAALDENGKLDIPRLKPIARLGYYDYTYVEHVFEMKIPGASQGMMNGLEGQTGAPGKAAG
ncbi:MAG: flavin reductase family protein [Rhodospirillales bacterium]|nr:flavin reductase family protein [Rhodospirillales bacterium]